MGPESIIKIVNSSFTKNSATAVGGAVGFFGPVKSTFVLCNFINNKAKGYGGAIYFRDSIQIQMNSVGFYNNTAQTGALGAISSYGPAHVYLKKY